MKRGLSNPIGSLPDQVVGKNWVLGSSKEFSKRQYAQSLDSQLHHLVCNVVRLANR